MNIYFELNQGTPVEGSRYWTRTGITNKAVWSIKYHGLLMHSDRVWTEDGTEVKFVKNRFEDPRTTSVDLDEFMWVKLRSKVL